MASGLGKAKDLPNDSLSLAPSVHESGSRSGSKSGGRSASVSSSRSGSRSSSGSGSDWSKYPFQMNMSCGRIRLASGDGRVFEPADRGRCSKAFFLYKSAIQARREGKAVGIAVKADDLEAEFVGLEGE